MYNSALNTYRLTGWLPLNIKPLQRFEWVSVGLIGRHGAGNAFSKATCTAGLEGDVNNAMNQKRKRR